MATVAANSTAAPSALANMPKSYLPKEEREELLRQGDMDSLYVAEAVAACDSSDADAVDVAWEWMAKVKLPPTALKMIKAEKGSQFVKEKGFITSLADAEYGTG